MKNFWRMRDFSVFSVHYAYVDHGSYLADQLFVQNRVRVRLKGEMRRKDSQYCIIFCKVLKQDVKRFEESLERLKDKMLVLGHKDYQDECAEIEKIIEEGMNVRRKSQR